MPDDDRLPRKYGRGWGHATKPLREPVATAADRPQYAGHVHDVNSSPILIDVGDSEKDFQGGNQAIGIKFNDSVVIRVTIVHDD